MNASFRSLFIFCGLFVCLSGLAQTPPKRVGVFLPFQLGQAPPPCPSPADPILSFYEGLQLAQRQWADSGLALQVLAFDTRRDPKRLDSLLEQKELRELDLLIGSVYASETEILARFAEKYDIPLVNPLSARLSWDSTAQNCLLWESTLLTQARSLARLMKEENRLGKVIVVTAEEPRQKAWMAAYTKALQEQGGKILAQETFREGLSLGTVLKGKKMDSTGHIVVCSDEPSHVGALMITLQRLGIRNMPVVVSSAMLSAPSFTLAQLENYRVWFSYPRYSDSFLPSVQAFRQTYHQQTGLPPDEYAAQGYDLAHTLFPVLQKTGKKGLIEALRQIGYRKTPAQTGVRFEPGLSDNQWVPWYKIENGDLLLINRP